MTEHETSRGLRSRSASPSSPHYAIRPGRKHSIITSARSPSVARQRAVALVGQVERHRALVAVQAEVVGGSRPARAGPRPRVVAAVGALDLHDVGAEVAEEHRRERAGEHAREVGDEQTGERAGGSVIGAEASLPWSRCRTLVVSDLHLGSPGRVDLLRRPELRAPLLEALDGVDRLVILGDGLELRESAAPRGGGDRRAVFADLGRALGPDGEIVLVAGNHDHGLVAGWIDGRLQTEPAGFLGLEHRIAPRDAGPLAAALAEHAAPARVEVAYPGIWLRDDVYALHGHWADVHSTVPTFERLAAGAMVRWVVTMPPGGATPDDYEAILSPLYAWMHALTQRSEHRVLSAGAGASARAWVMLAGEGRRAPAAACAALGAGYGAAIGVRQPAGHRPRPPRPLRRRAAPRCAARDARGAAPSGHHRALRDLGPLTPLGAVARRRPPANGRRRPARGSSMPAPGCYERHYLGDSPSSSPYWPGTAVLVEDERAAAAHPPARRPGHAQLRCRQATPA